MDKIEIADKAACNQILNKYRAEYFYDYDRDCFIDKNYDINPPASKVKVKGGEKNLFQNATKAGCTAMSKELKNLKTKKLTLAAKWKKLRNSFSSEYANKILTPYGKFTSTEHKKDAYEFAKKLNVRICPYCNINYIDVVEVSKTGEFICRPDFDHFYSKSKHPELQLNLYNLVPSCQVCNRTIKLNKEFTEKKNLNPYKLSFDKIKYFDIEFSQEKGKDKDLELNDDECILSVLKNEISEDCFKIVFKNRKTVPKAYRKKADGNIKDFRLYERYQYHKDVVIDIFKRCKAYYDSRIKELASLSEETKEAFYNALFSDAHCEINKTSLGKLKRDIIANYVQK